VGFFAFVKLSFREALSKVKKKFESKKLIAIVAIFLSFNQIYFASSSFAAKGYRYWGYFQAAPSETKWTAAMSGPTTVLKDGAVEGWSFSASNDVIPATAPSDSPDFESLCADTPVIAGKIRVGLVINFGPDAIAPNNEMPPNTILTCSHVKKGATGVDVLNATVDVRNDKSGLLCGIEGYPKSECGPEIDMPEVAVAATANSVTSEENKEKEELGADLDIGPIIAVSLAGLIAIGLAVGIKRRRKI
jgi:hypothetical protein